jgi:outer membrane protein
LTIAIIHFSHAQEDSVLTYEQAVNIALRENIQIRQQQNILEVNEAQRLQGYANFLPSVDMSFRAERSYGRIFDQTTSDFATQQATFGNGGIGASLTIFNGFGRYNQLRQAQSATKAQIQQIAQTKQDVIFSVSQQYLQVLLEQQLLKIARANLEQQNELLESVETFVEAGTQNLADQYNQEAIAKSAVLDVVEAENRLAISKVQLIRTLQIDPFKEWQFAEPDIDQMEMLIEETNLEQAYNQAIENRADLQQLRYQIEANRKSISVARSAYSPSLVLDYGYYSRYSSLDLINRNQPEERVLPFREQVFEKNPVSAVGLSLYIPIFDRLQTNTLVQRNKQILNNSELDLEDLKRNLFEQLQTATADYRAAQQRVISSEAQVKAAEKALEAEKERFRLGVGNILDLNRISALHIEALAKKVQADYTLIFQQTAMDYYTGQLQADNLSIK